MKVFVLAVIFTLASADADAQVPFTAFASGPVVAHAPVAHHAVHAPLVAHAPVLAHAPVAHALHHGVVHTPVHSVLKPLVHHAPAHHAVVHHAPVHHAVHHAPAYHVPHYEKKHNCSIVDVVESAEVCTPAFETVCENIEVATKIIVDMEQCYP